MFLKLKQMFLTRSELGNRVNAPPYSYFNEMMVEVFHKGEAAKNIVFHSDVYFVRSALEKHTGYVIPLPVVEKAMLEEGWYEGKVNRRKK